tara:strand:+ start:3839 stop:4210 length:372 start_codon:yes stop_codon:yes gene_type:complete
METNLNNIQMKEYSDKSIIIFGDTKPYKDLLKELKGRYNSNLRVDGEKAPGWIFSKKHKEKLEKLIQHIKGPQYQIAQEIKELNQKLMNKLIMVNNLHVLNNIKSSMKDIELELSNCSDVFFF